MLLQCPSCRSEVFKRHQNVPLVCPNCGVSARPSWWQIAARLLLVLVLGSGLYVSIILRTWWPVLAGLLLSLAGTFPLRYIPLVRMEPWEITVHRIIHNLILMFLLGLVLLAGYAIFSHG